MKAAEIKALLAEHKDKPEWMLGTLELLLLDAIETLLARQAEVVKYTHECGITRNSVSGSRIRAILNPENEI